MKISKYYFIILFFRRENARNADQRCNFWVSKFGIKIEILVKKIFFAKHFGHKWQ